MTGILVLGAGGHGKAVADILLAGGETVLGFLDDERATWGTERLGLPVLGATDTYHEHYPTGLVLGVGSNQARGIIVGRLGNAAATLWRRAIHPRAVVASSASLEPGAVVMAGAVVGPDVKIGAHVIVNHGATVDHDCVVSPFAHVAPGANVAGGVNIGEGSLVGIGSAVLPYQTIGDWATIGAGAVVNRDVPAGVTASGVPVRWN